MPSPPTSRWRWKKVDWSSSRSRTTALALGWVKDLSAHAWLWTPNKITRNAHTALRHDRKDPLERLGRLHQVRFRLFELVFPLHRDCVCTPRAGETAKNSRLLWSSCPFHCNGRKKTWKLFVKGSPPANSRLLRTCQPLQPMGLEERWAELMCLSSSLQVI